jgi:hypothetical protein
MALRPIPSDEIDRLSKTLRKKLFGKSNKKISLRRYESHVRWVLRSQGDTCLLAGGNDAYCWNMPKNQHLSHLKLEWARKNPGANGGRYKLNNLCLMCTRCNNQLQTSLTLPNLLVELTHKAAVLTKLCESTSEPD